MFNLIFLSFAARAMFVAIGWKTNFCALISTLHLTPIWTRTRNFTKAISNSNAKPRKNCERKMCEEFARKFFSVFFSCLFFHFIIIYGSFTFIWRKRRRYKYSWKVWIVVVGPPPLLAFLITEPPFDSGNGWSSPHSPHHLHTYQKDNEKWKGNEMNEMRGDCRVVERDEKSV